MEDFEMTSSSVIHNLCMKTAKDMLTLFVDKFGSPW